MIAFSFLMPGTASTWEWTCAYEVAHTLLCLIKREEKEKNKKEKKKKRTLARDSKLTCWHACTEPFRVLPAMTKQHVKQNNIAQGKPADQQETVLTPGTGTFSNQVSEGIQ